MILHAWVIREMVGVIPRYCPAVTRHVNTDQSGLQGEGEEEDGGPDVLRERETGCDQSVITFPG